MMNNPASAPSSASSFTTALTTAQILVAGGKRDEAVALLASEIANEVLVSKNDDHIAIGVIAALVASKRAYEEHNEALRSILKRVKAIERVDQKISEEQRLLTILEEIEEMSGGGQKVT